MSIDQFTAVKRAAYVSGVARALDVADDAVRITSVLEQPQRRVGESDRILVATTVRIVAEQEAFVTAAVNLENLSGSLANSGISALGVSTPTVVLGDVPVSTPSPVFTSTTPTSTTTGIPTLSIIIISICILIGSSLMVFPLYAIYNFAANMYSVNRGSIHDDTPVRVVADMHTEDDDTTEPMDTSATTPRQTSVVHSPTAQMYMVPLDAICGVRVDMQPLTRIEQPPILADIRPVPRMPNLRLEPLSSNLENPMLRDENGPPENAPENEISRFLQKGWNGYDIGTA